jgi:hypothetical protein
MAEQTEDKIITFEQYYDPMLAHIIRTRLEDNGIPALLPMITLYLPTPYIQRGWRHQTKNI